MTRLARVKIGRKSRSSVPLDSLLNISLACGCALLLWTQGILRLDAGYMLVFRYSVHDSSRPGSPRPGLPFLVDRILPRCALPVKANMVQLCTMYSTAQVARILKIGRQTLHRWLNEGLKAPKKSKIAGVS